MAALGWYQESSPGRWPEDAPPSGWSGSFDLWMGYISVNGGVIGTPNGPVTWTFLWNGAPEMPFQIAPWATDTEVYVNLQNLHYAVDPARGVLLVSAADSSGPLDGVLRLAIADGGGVYGHISWDVVGAQTPAQPEFWMGFINAYEVP